jgi:hypothetical protein
MVLFCAALCIFTQGKSRKERFVCCVVWLRALSKVCKSPSLQDERHDYMRWTTAPKDKHDLSELGTQLA